MQCLGYSGDSGYYPKNITQVGRGQMIRDRDIEGHEEETPKLGVSSNAANGNGGNTNTNGENTNTNGVSTNADDGNAGDLNHKWKPSILSVIINQYKRICTIHARKTNPDFVWRSRFCDHIIRNEKAYLKISEYVINNPLKWQDDEHISQSNKCFFSVFE